VAINATLASLLKGAGVTIQFVAPQQFPGKVVSPAVKLSYPFITPDVPNVGSFRGTATLIIGAATAQMSGASATGSLGATAPGAAPASSGGGGSQPELSTPVGSEPVLSEGTVPSTIHSPAGAVSPVPPSAQTPVPAQAISPAAVPASAVGSPKGFDIESVYLIVVLGALAASAAGALIRRVGVRT
jgi:hypothetical protein